jgi:hypothetical protein
VLFYASELTTIRLAKDIFRCLEPHPPNGITQPFQELVYSFEITA